MRDVGVTEGDISATTGHSIAVVRAVYSNPLPKESRGGTDAIATGLGKATDDFIKRLQGIVAECNCKKTSSGHQTGTNTQAQQ